MADNVYSHRNGESEVPAVAAYYWFMRTGMRHGWIVTVVQYNRQGEMRSYSGTSHHEEYRELEPGRWWGPVTPPWEQENG